MKARLLLIYILLLITACGFHLRGSQTTMISVDNIFINGDSALAKEVKSQFANAGTSFATSSQNASYIVTLKNRILKNQCLAFHQQQERLRNIR